MRSALGSLALHKLMLEGSELPVTALEKELGRFELAVARNRARQAVDAFTRLSDEELLSNRAPMQRARRRFLETALAYYQGFLEQHRDDPSLEVELAASSARVCATRSEASAWRSTATISRRQRPRSNRPFR